MKLKRLMALVMSIALAVASYPFVRVAAQVPNPVVPSQQAIQATGLAVSGTVVRSKGKTSVAEACLRLRKLDTDAIVDSTVSDKNGAFSLASSGPGMYLVEAINCENSGVLSVSEVLTLAQSPLTTLVVLPTVAAASFFSSTAFLVIAAASAAGIAGVALARGNTPSVVSSPEQ